MTRPGVILFDLDDTLYAYEVAEAAATEALLEQVAKEVSIPRLQLLDLYKKAKRAVKGRIPGQGSSHSRLLYLSELAHAIQPSLMQRVRSWERSYWTVFLRSSALRDGAMSLITAARKAGIKIAIVSDLTLEVQLWKLEHLGLLQHLDALVTSEEVQKDKPSEAPFLLALHRLNAAANDCVMIGDRDDKDGAGAKQVGIPYIRIDTGDGQGKSFRQLANEWGLT